MSKSLIAKLYNISDNTVQTVFDKVYDNDKLYKNFLPEAICIDEFTYKKKHLLLIYVMQKLVKQLMWLKIEQHQI